MVKEDGQIPSAQPQPQTSASLPAEWFLEALELPLCKTEGRCDGCGQCGG